MKLILRKIPDFLQRPAAHIILITLIGLLAYSNTFNVPFQFDDRDNIIGNHKLQDIQNFWPPSESRWFGFLTFALNYHFGKLNTVGYHIVNFIIHILNAILVYWFVILTFSTPFFRNQQTEEDSLIQPFTLFPLFVALIFVSHPIQTQAVTYIVQRFTSLATMFYLLSLVMYIKWRLLAEQKISRAKDQKSELHASRYSLYAASLFSAVLAMKTKEISFTLPVIITLYEFMFFEGNTKRRLLFLVPMLLTILIIPLSIIGTDKPIEDAIGDIREGAYKAEELPGWSYLLTQFRVIVTYIRLLLLPINQNIDYDYPIFNSFFNPEVFLSLLFLLFILAFGIYLLYAIRYTLYASRFLAFGILWFFITLSVESSVIPIKDIIFEHRVYLPSVGAVIAFSISIFYSLQFITRRSQIFTSYFLLFPVIVVTLLIVTYQRNIVWQDEVRIWEDAAKKSPQKVRVYYNLGKIYSAKGWTDKAIENYQIATRVKPDCIEAHNNLGVEYSKKGWIDKAIEHYLIAIWLGPDFQVARNNLGNAYVAKGWIDKAIEHYSFALRLKPDFIEAHNNLAIAYEKKGLIENAIEEYQKALSINPEFKPARDNLNNLLRLKKK